MFYVFLLIGNNNLSKMNKGTRIMLPGLNQYISRQNSNKTPPKGATKYIAISTPELEKPIAERCRREFIGCLVSNASISFHICDAG